MVQRGLTSTSLAAALVLLIALPVARADNAPMWESPIGLTPGGQTTVRMAAEQVDVQVVERGSAAIAVVAANFDMVNSGAAQSALVGFPNFAYAVAPGDEYSPVTFNPMNLSNFHAWTDSTTFSPQKRTVNFGRFGGSEWFVWTMAYPAKGAIRVHVEYEQKLDEQVNADYYRPVVHVSYVLRTGALWAGNIGQVHVTFAAPNGGGFVGAERAVQLADDHIQWQFSDLKPTFDLDTAYVYAGPWQELRAAEAAVNGEGAGGQENLRAAKAALRLLGTDGPYRVPPALVNRYGAAMRQWARSASSLDTAEAWETVGDVEQFWAKPKTKNHGEFACWPEAGAAAYERAADLGSQSAADKRSGFDQTVAFMQQAGFDPVPLCQ